ncbi:MAG: CDP-glucose 4,6-dehydratase [Actinobacteria bacterium]|nr:MAG: CDP-glucose 4,6-dehydratase [Actinomycetota bacterium]
MQAPFGGAFTGTRVLVTGHTGFKGSWLTRWLLDLGAEVTGYALEPDTTPSLFSDLRLGADVDSRIGDVRDAERLAALVAEVRPEVVLHLAAQPLVRRSYAEPRYTFETNVLGTVNLLEAVRAQGECRVVVNVTTDKVYANPETGEPFAEKSPLGGFDPYSASKAASEIVTASYRDAFFSAEGSAAIATARAGNVIGGGDWATDRIVPDCARALAAHESVVVRNPASVRPWQHVLEPLSGYLRLAALLLADSSLAGPFNFGPDTASSRTVSELVEAFVSAWGEGSWSVSDETRQPHEAAQLRLDIGKAERQLAWRPLWSFDETVARTACWYRAYASGESAEALVRSDISAYESAACAGGAAWAGREIAT